MAETRNLVVNSTNWVTVNPFDDISSAIVQLQGTGPVLMVVRQGRSPGPSEHIGLMLDSNGLAELPISGLLPGDKVFLRSVQTNEENVVAVLVETNAPLGGV